MNEEVTRNPAFVFGQFLRRMRLQNGLTARDAAASAEMLPSNFSKMEHGVLLPPRDHDKQRRLAAAAGIAEGSSELVQFFDLASKATKTTPVDLAQIISESETVPLLLRTIGNKRLSDEEIRKLVALVHGNG